MKNRVNQNRETERKGGEGGDDKREVNGGRGREGKKRTKMRK